MAAGPTINTHFNHPREVTPEAAAACKKLARLGIPLGNQTVLLAGVNDDAAIIKELFHKLLTIRVRPYYFFQCDRVVGADHLRTNVWKGVEIMEALRGHTSGLAVPTFAIDAPGGGGKIPFMPNYMVSAAPGLVVLRNYEGATFTYADRGIDCGEQPAGSVADLASGKSQRIIPLEQRHYARRKPQS